MAASTSVNTVRPDDLLLIARQLAIGIVGKSQGRPREAELQPGSKHCVLCPVSYPGWLRGRFARRQDQSPS